MMGVVFPVSTPFIFFSIRSPIRLISKERDVHRLFEFALPFMTVLSVGFLVATSGYEGKCGQLRRELLDGNSVNIQLNSFNSSYSGHQAGGMVETEAKFAESYHGNLSEHGTSLGQNTAKYALFLMSPFLVFWAIKVLIAAILTGHTTEFMTAFLLVTSARYGMLHVMGFWSALALSGAGSAFVLLLCNVRA
jgi:hypothetical protein